MLLENLDHIYRKYLSDIGQTKHLSCFEMYHHASKSNIFIVVCDAQILHMMNRRIYFHCTKTGIHITVKEPD